MKATRSATGSTASTRCSTRMVETPRLAQRADRLADLRDHRRHQTLGRLVEQQHLRLEAERPRHGQHLLLAAGQRAGALAEPFAQQREKREHARRASPRPCRAPSGRSRGSRRRQLGEQPPALRHIGDAGLAAPHAAAAPVSSRSPSRIEPAARRDQAHDRLEQRRLAGAVAAEQAQHLALAQRERRARAAPAPRRRSSRDPEMVSASAIGRRSRDRRAAPSVLRADRVGRSLGQDRGRRRAR